MFFGVNLPVPRLVWTSPRPRQKGAVVLIASKFVDSSNVQSVSNCQRQRPNMTKPY